MTIKRINMENIRINKQLERFSDEELNDYLNLVDQNDMTRDDESSIFFYQLYQERYRYEEMTHHLCSNTNQIGTTVDTRILPPPVWNLFFPSLGFDIVDEQEKQVTWRFNIDIKSWRGIEDGHVIFKKMIDIADLELKYDILTTLCTILRVFYGFEDCRVDYFAKTIKGRYYNPTEYAMLGQCPSLNDIPIPVRIHMVVLFGENFNLEAFTDNKN